MTAPDALAALHGRLLPLREDLRGLSAWLKGLSRLGWRCWPMSRPLSSGSTAMPEPAARAVVSDDGSTIWLTAYTKAGILCH